MQRCLQKQKGIKAKLEAERTIVEVCRKSLGPRRTNILGQLQQEGCRKIAKTHLVTKIDKRHIQVQSPIRAVGLVDVRLKDLSKTVTSVINLRVQGNQLRLVDNIWKKEGSLMAKLKNCVFSLKISWQNNLFRGLIFIDETKLVLSENISIPRTSLVCHRLIFSGYG